MTDGDLRIGVDLGGTKTEAVALRLGGARPEILARTRIATQREDGYEAIVTRTRDLVLRVAHAAHLEGELPPVGLAMPGAVTFKRPDGARSDVPLVKNSNTTCLNGRPFRGDLERALGQPVAVANDANCFAVAEATWGAARGARVAFGVILGTGVGGAVVLADGTRPRAWDGAQGIAGEWGHLVLDPEGGPPCYCGRRGCVETYLSGVAMERAYAARTGAPRRLAEVARLADGGDRTARAFLEERMEIFGRAMALVIDVLDPDVIVLGGGASNLELLYSAGVEAVGRWVFNDELRTRLVKNELGDSAGVLGAALLP